MASFTIGKKLYLGVGALLAFTFALGITAYFSMSSIGDRMNAMASSTMKETRLAHQMDTASSDLLAEDRGILLRGFMKDQATMQKYSQQFESTMDELQKELGIMQSMLHKPEGIKAAKEMEDTLAPLRQASQTVFQAAMAGNMDAASTAYTESVLPLLKSQKAAVIVLLKIQDDLLAEDTAAAMSAVQTNRWINALLLSLACCAGIALVYVVRQIVRVLRDSVINLSESAVQIASAAGQVAASSQSLAQGSSEQAATIEETSSASAEINSMARRTTESSSTAAEIVAKSQDGFARTNESLTQMVGAMEAINSSSQKISKIIKVIDEIAFQTNILALNAAVEAARAGEAGMGFAVVADEVRNLAQRCAQAAKDTADLIEESIQNSNGGRVKVDQVAVAIREITTESGKIKVLVDEINLGSVEQSRGIDQISKAVTQMEQVTQSSAANAEESAAAAEELNSQAETMKDVIESLRAMVDGSSSRHANGASHSSGLRSFVPARA
jgi:methyl-accepting chemotaxis protein